MISCDFMRFQVISCDPLVSWLLAVSPSCRVFRNAWKSSKAKSDLRIRSSAHKTSQAVSTDDALISTNQNENKTVVFFQDPVKVQVTAGLLSKIVRIFLCAKGPMPAFPLPVGYPMAEHKTKVRG